jgi:nucleotide-binding universal stress UspA family protein
VIRTVLCAVDRSPASLDVARMGRRLREELGVRVVLAHVAEEAGPHGDGEPGFGLLERARAHRMLERVTREAGLPDADLRVEAGERSRLLARLAAEEGARLILVGARRGRLRGIRSALARRLSLETTCPVLVVPPAPGGRGGPRHG